MAKKNRTPEDTEEQANELTAFETKLVNLLALLVTQERKQVEQIDILGRAGFRPVEIASLLGTTRNTVSVALSKQKQERNRSKNK